MRNLREYPVTYKEKVDLLNKYRQQKEDNDARGNISFGDITLTILDNILEDLWQLDDLRNS